MALEIERKFLVKGEFRQDAFSSTGMKQGYICSAHGRTVRVRIAGERAYLTIKGPSDESGLSRFEWEKEIGVEEAEELFLLAGPGIIEKTRHYIHAGDGIHTWEVDEFHGENEGLVVAEIELRTPEDTFQKPSWLGEEVTGDHRYSNSSLSRNPYRSWD